MAAYQVILLRGGSQKFETDTEGEVRAELERQVVALGLDASELTFILSTDLLDLDGTLPAVAVYVSDSDPPGELAAVQELERRAILVLPYVADLRRFTHVVPEPLRRINGMARDPNNARHERLVGRVLEELRLLRRKRSAFISYRRVESSGVAEQLRERLQERRYDVFLDSYSVEYGVDFQSALWDALGNTDVVVLLNTKTVFDSQWVEQEITRVNAAGIAVVRVVWPGVAPQRDVDFAEPVYLSESDFVDDDASSGVKATLLPKKANEIAEQVERLRARAQAARRCRVIAELKQAADGAGIRMTLEHDGVARLERAATTLSAGTTKRVIPVIGYPDASVAQEHALRIVAGDPPWDHLLYDSLGMIEKTRADHLAWLNLYLPSKSLAVQGIEQWLKTNLT